MPMFSVLAPAFSVLPFPWKISPTIRHTQGNAGNLLLLVESPVMGPLSLGSPLRDRICLIKHLHYVNLVLDT